MAASYLERRHRLIYLLFCALLLVFRLFYLLFLGNPSAVSKEQFAAHVDNPSSNKKIDSVGPDRIASTWVSRTEYRLCHECNIGYKGNSNCRNMIYSTPEAYHNKTTLVSQMATVLKACPQCDPNTCKLAPYRRLRPDHAAPPLLFTKDFSTFPSMVGNNPEQLVLYNPSILALTAEMKKDLRLFPQSVYVASFRVTNVGPCGTYNGRSGQINHVGIALLNDKLDIVAHTVMNPNNETLWPEQLMESKMFTDARLFYTQNQLILSHGANVFPIQLTNTRPLGASYVWENQIVASTQMPKTLFVSIPGEFPPRVQFLEPAPTRGSKNFQFFSSDGKDWIEQWPYPHQVRGLDNLTQQHEIAHLAKQRAPLIPAFEVHDLFAVWNVTVSKDRLTACCIDLQKDVRDDQSPVFKVGVAHVKNKDRVKGNANGWGYFYLSRFYAFRPTPPFELVALSGFFCLAGGGSGSRLSQPNGFVYSCPAITYISGLTVNPNNASEVVMAYGAADCIGHIVIVHMNDIRRRLFERLDEISMP